jgi:hypothetical protein
MLRRMLLAGTPASPLSAHPEPVELWEVALSHLPDLGVSSVHIDCPRDLRVLADPAYLDEIVVNLVENADKYGAPPITVSARQVGEVVELTVSDCGSGVPEGFTSRLFERYSRADETLRHRSGTGSGSTWWTSSPARAAAASATSRTSPRAPGSSSRSPPREGVPAGTLPVPATSHSTTTRRGTAMTRTPVVVGMLVAVLLVACGPVEGVTIGSGPDEAPETRRGPVSLAGSDLFLVLPNELSLDVPSCNGDPELVQLVEDPDAVRLEVVTTQVVRGPSDACLDGLHVPLGAPLGDRDVVDLVSGAMLAVVDQTEVLECSDLDYPSSRRSRPPRRRSPTR